MLLKVENICVHYGRAMALDNISMGVEEGSVVCIIGANGAGKSTIMRTISGLIPLTSGNILFDNEQINGLAVHDIVKMGLVHVPEGRRLFPYLTVLDNLSLGATLRKERERIEKDYKMVFDLFPVLESRREQKAGTLSGGEQQMLAIARGLMAAPRLLLLDEPSVGLAPMIVQKVGDVIKEINREGISVLLVEQNVPLALGVAQKGYALQVGRVVLEGSIDVLRSNEALKRAYLGG